MKEILVYPYEDLFLVLNELREYISKGFISFMVVHCYCFNACRFENYIPCLGK